SVLCDQIFIVRSAQLFASLVSLSISALLLFGSIIERSSLSSEVPTTSRTNSVLNALGNRARRSRSSRSSRRIARQGHLRRHACWNGIQRTGRDVNFRQSQSLAWFPIGS